MKAQPYTWAIVAGVAGLTVVALYIVAKGGAKGAATAAGAAVVNAGIDVAGGLATGAVTATSEAVGLPTPAETTTDPAVARWLIDTHGYFTASKWAGLPALIKGAAMDAGTGTPPPAGSPMLKALPPVASYDETTRLLKRYPEQETAPAFGAQFYGWGVGS